MSESEREKHISIHHEDEQDDEDLEDELEDDPSEGDTPPDA